MAGKEGSLTEEALEQLLKLADSPCILVDPDGMRVLNGNDLAAEMFRVEQDVLSERTFGELIGCGDGQFPSLVDGQRFEGFCRNGKPFEVSVRDVDGKALCWIHSLEKLHQAEAESKENKDLLAALLKRLEDTVAGAEERFALLGAISSQALWDWSLRSNEVFYSPRWLEMFGLDAVSNSAEEWFSRIHPEDVNEVETKLNDCLEGRLDTCQHEHRIRHTDGRYVWVLCQSATFRDSEDNAIRLAGSLTDLTVIREAEHRMLAGAFYDDLTALPNRNLFVDRLTRAMVRSRRNDSGAIAVLHLDIDNLRRINDGLGQQAGDDLLCQVGKRLSAQVRN